MKTSTFNFPRVVLFSCLSAAILSGCGKDKVLDYRNAEVVHGKVYAHGADEPFSGQATNVPRNVIFGAQGGFSTARQLLLATIPAGSMLDRIVFAASYCNIHLRDGVLDGEAACTEPQNNLKKDESHFKSGALDGKYIMYVPGKADVLLQASFKEGVLDGTVQIFSPDTQKLIYRGDWNKGQADGLEERFDKDTSLITARSTFKSGKADGEILRFAKNGKDIIYRVKAIAGQKDGDEQEFDEQTGKLIRLTTWRNGVADGPSKQWDAQGNLTSDKLYRNGTEVAPTPAAANLGGQSSMPLASMDGCIAMWTSAHRKQVGEDALITGAQLEEWTSWCKQGKNP